MSGGFIWVRALRYDFPAGENLMLAGGSRSAGCGTGPLPRPTTHGIILSGGGEGERAGTLASTAQSAWSEAG